MPPLGAPQESPTPYRCHAPSGRAKFSQPATVTDVRLPPDYEDLLREFVESGVEFLLIGGWAVAVHGHGRATDDMDLLVRPTATNAKKVFAALLRYGAPIDSHGVTEELFSRPRYGYRMGRKPVLIEVLTTIDGVTFDQAIEGAIAITVAGRQVPVIGREALLTNKRAAGRAKDLADIEALESRES